MLLPDSSGQLKNQTEQLIQSSLDALAAHVAILNNNGIIIGVNASWCRFADENNLNDPSYALGTSYLAVCDNATGKFATEGKAVSHGIRDVMSYTSADFYLEYPCHGPNEKRWFVMHVTRFEWNGHPRFIIAHQNVTEVKQVQVKLEESQKRLQAILDHVLNGIITLNEQGRIESVNPAAAHIFDYPPEAMMNLPIDELVQHEVHTEAPHELLEHVHSTDWEITGLRRDGSTFPMYLGVSKVVIGSRRIYTAIIQDMTERKRMQEEMLENEKLRLALDKERELRDLKNRFITMMSHELRTPLASIMLSSGMLKNYGALATPDEQVMYLDNINTQVEHLTEMIKDVQTISRGDGQSSTFMPQITDLVEYCRHIVDEFNMNHRQSHRVSFDSVRDVISTMLDHKLMRQVITNLLSNAIKYSPDTSDITVQIRNGGRTARIIVSDKGVGIPQEDQQHLFEPFHRGSNVEQMAGTGLGLAIAKQATELHGGRIEVQSEVNIGTIVTIHLPIYLEYHEDHKKSV